MGLHVNINKSSNQQCQPEFCQEPNQTVVLIYPIKTNATDMFAVISLDPFEQWNRVHALTDAERLYLQDQLAQLKACRGTKQCTVGNAASSASQMHTGSNTSTTTMGNTASLASVGSHYKKKKKKKYHSLSKFTTRESVLN